MNEYKEKIYNSIISGVVDYELFIEIAYIIVEDLNLKDYVKNISVVCLNFGVDGLYDRTNKKIIIERKDMQYILHLGGYYYYHLFEILFHEIEHAKQCKLCDECVPYLDELVRGHSFRLTAPYSEERRNAASKAAKKHSGNLTHPIQKDVL